jgi:hypothetical protein
MNDFPEESILNRRDWIAGLDKDLAILEAFDLEHPRMTATEAAERAGLTALRPAATCSRWPTSAIFIARASILA